MSIHTTRLRIHEQADATTTGEAMLQIQVLHFVKKRLVAIVLQRAATQRSCLDRALHCALCFLLVLTPSLCSPSFAGDDSLATTDDAVVIEGFSQPNRLSEVASATAGILATRTFSPGAEVRRGECVAKIDARTFAKSVEVARLRGESEGSLKAAEAETRAAKRRVAILRELAKQKSATPEELLRAEMELEQTQARVISAREQNLIYAAEYEKLLAQSDEFCIKAPFDGVIVEYAKQAGEWIGPTDPHVCTIAELDKLRVDFLVPAPLVKQLRPDTTTPIRFTDDRSRVQGTITYIAPYATAETNTVEVHVVLDNASRKLVAGTRCQLEIPTKRAE